MMLKNRIRKMLSIKNRKPANKKNKNKKIKSLTKMMNKINKVLILYDRTEIRKIRRGIR